MDLVKKLKIVCKWKTTY